MAPLYRPETSVTIRPSTLLALVGTRTIWLRPLLITGLVEVSANHNSTVRVPGFDIRGSLRDVGL